MAAPPIAIHGTRLCHGYRLSVLALVPVARAPRTARFFLRGMRTR